MRTLVEYDTSLLLGQVLPSIESGSPLKIALDAVVDLINIGDHGGHNRQDGRDQR